VRGATVGHPSAAAKRVSSRGEKNDACV
jgi:hypothetical protein